MLNDLEIVTEVIEDVDPGFRRRLVIMVLFDTLFNFGLVYFQILALAHQRAGQPYGNDALSYALMVMGGFLATRYAWNSTSDGLARGMHALTTRIVQRLRRLPLSRFEQLGRGTLMMQLTGDTRRIINATRPLIAGPQSIIRLGIGAAFLLFLSPNFAAVVVAAMIGMGFVVAMQMQGMAAGFGRVAGKQVRMYELLRGHIAGATSIQQHRPRAAAIGAAFSAISASIRELRTGTFGQFFERQHLANAILYSVLGVNVFILPLIVSADSEMIREVNLVLVWGAFSIMGLVFSLPELSQAAAATERLLELESSLPDEVLEPRVDPSTAVSPLSERFEALRVRGLTFTYPSSPERPGFRVGPIDLDLRRGEIVFITGDNGSGKSTFLKMLTSLYPAQAGQLLLDAEPVTPARLASYRMLFTTVFVDHHLFARAFARDPEADTRAAPLLREMEVDHVTNIVDGRVTHRALSTGQKKRLAMVLARLEQRPILIFDEWAADQDPEFRAIYYNKILPAFKAAGKLVIAVTHDDQYFHCADRLIHFHAGQLARTPPARGAS